MKCKFNLKDDTMTILMPKEVDHYCASQLRNEADFLIDAHHVKKLVFDFSDTDFMDSSGIGVIIGRCRKMNFLDGVVEAIHANERIQKIFIVSGLHKMVALLPDCPMQAKGEL